MPGLLRHPRLGRLRHMVISTRVCVRVAMLGFELAQIMYVLRAERTKLH